MPAQPLSTEQRQDATRLKELYQAWKIERKKQGLEASQEALLQGVSWRQSTISQYMNGTIPLNPTAVIEFARSLGVAPVEISPEIGELLRSWIPIASRVAGGQFHSSSPKTEPALEAGMTPAMLRYAKTMAGRSGRTLHQQLQYWSRIGAASEPSMTIAQVMNLLESADLGVSAPAGA